MRCDNRIPVALVHKLHPGEVHLYDGGAAPLASLKQDDADGLVPATLLLHLGNETTLRTVESERDILTTRLGLDTHEGISPEGKVVLGADLDEHAVHMLQRRVIVVREELAEVCIYAAAFEDMLDEGFAHHFFGHKLHGQFVIGNTQFNPVTDTILSGNRVKVLRQLGIADIVQLQYFSNRILHGL